MAPQKKKQESYVAICKHNHGAEPGHIFVGTYKDVLEQAVKWWTTCYGLQYDLTQKPNEFYDEEGGEVEIFHEKNGNVAGVSHSYGDGPDIWIQEASKKL